MATIKGVPGSIHSQYGRYFWTVKKPGEKGYSRIALKPVGSRYATKDIAVAKELAKIYYQDMLQKIKVAKREDYDQTMATLIKLYLAHTDKTKPSEHYRREWATRPLIKNCPQLCPEEFGPLKLQQIRDIIIDQTQMRRTTINGVVKQWVRMFKWAVSQELVSVRAYQALTTVESLKKGHPGTIDSKKVKSVKDEYVDKCLPYTSQVVADMIRLQRLTGMRSGELVTLRPVDIDKETVKGVWLYMPNSHKTDYLDFEKVIPLGKKSQNILKKYMVRPPEKYCFSPAQSLRQIRQVRHEKRTTPQKYGNNIGTNITEEPQWTASEKYTTGTYRQAVEYAQQAAKADGKKIKRWTPHQLRHSRATELNKQYGQSAVKAALGHLTLTASQGYIDRDLELAISVAQ
jgi:integrase